MFEKENLFPIEGLIKKKEEELEWRKRSIVFANEGISWLEERKSDIETDVKIKFSFSEFEFGIDKATCMSLLQYIKYCQEQLMPFTIDDIEHWKSEKRRMESKDNENNGIPICITL